MNKEIDELQQAVKVVISGWLPIKISGNIEANKITIEQLIEAIIKFIGLSNAQQSVGFKGVISPNSPGPDAYNSPRFWITTEPGVYVNYGGVIVTKNFAIIAQSEAGFSLSESDISDVFTKSDVIKALSFNMWDENLFPSVEFASNPPSGKVVAVNNAYSEGKTIRILAGQTGDFSFVKAFTNFTNFKIGQTVNFYWIVEHEASYENQLLYYKARYSLAGNWVDMPVTETKISSTQRIYESSRLIDGTEDFFEGLVQTNNFTLVLTDTTFNIKEVKYYISDGDGNVTFNEYFDRKLNLGVAELEQKLTNSNDFNYTVIHVASAQGLPVEQGGQQLDFVGLNAIQDAMNSINDAGPLKRYKIKVHEGVFNVTSTSQFTYNFTGQFDFVYIKPYILVSGVDRDKCIINVSLPDSTANSILYNAIHCHADFGGIEHMSIIIRNGRYPIHVDYFNQGLKNTRVLIYDCYVEHLGCFGAAGAWQSCHVIGTGTSSGLLLNHKDCIFATLERPLYVHTNANFDEGSESDFENIGFIKNTGGVDDKVIGELQSLGSRRPDIIRLHGCWFSGGYIIKINDAPDQRSNPNTRSYKANDIRIVGSGNEPFLYQGSFVTGMALRINPLVSTAASKARFDETANAFPILVKDQYFTGGSFVAPDGEVNIYGYGYKDGGNGLRGYAIGRLDLSGVQLGSTSMGNRLGDCTGVNKILRIIISDTVYTVTFNKNYNGYNNNDVLSEINSVIGGVALADLYSVSADYYPELTDRLKIAEASSVIIKGFAVVIQNGRLRHAVSADKKISGVAIDYIQPGKRGRYVTSGYLESGTGSYFEARLKSGEAMPVFGEELGVSNEAGLLSRDAVNKSFYCFDNGVLSFNL